MRGLLCGCYHIDTMMHQLHNIADFDRSGEKGMLLFKKDLHKPKIGPPCGGRDDFRKFLGAIFGNFSGVI